MADLVVPRGFEQIVTVGCGAFGTVYSAWETNKKRKVAIKEYKVRQLSSGVLRAMKTELEIIPRISHPNLVQHFEVFNEIPGKIMLSMEFLESGSLSNLIDKYHQCRQNIPETFVWDITAQMVLALRYLHSPIKENASSIGRIIHRDLKPDNVFLSSTGAVKIGDFNLSRVIESADAKMTFAGTFSYMAPEILLRKPYNEKVDIWSLGCIVCEMCTNRPIFNFSHSTDYTAEFSKFSAQNLRLPQGMYSNDLIGFIYKILVVDHNARPSSSELAQVPQIVSAVKRLIERGVYDTSILNDLDYTLKHTSGSRAVQSGDDDLSRRGSRSVSTSRTSRPSSVHPVDPRRSSKQCGHAHAQPLESLEGTHTKGVNSGGFHDHGGHSDGADKAKRYPAGGPKEINYSLLENPSVYGDAAIRVSDRAHKDISENPRHFADGTTVSIDTSALPAYLKRMTDGDVSTRSRSSSSKHRISQSCATTTFQHSAFSGHGTARYDYQVEGSRGTADSRPYSRNQRSDSRASRNMCKSENANTMTPNRHESRQGLPHSLPSKDHVSKRAPMGVSIHGHTNLMKAATIGDPKGVKQWISQVRQYDEDGKTALMYAAISDSLNCVEILLPEECRMTDRVGNTALMHAVLNKRFNCIQLLLRQETGLRDIKGRTALMKAAATGQLSIATLLLGSEGGLATPDGSTALTYAANHNDIDMVNLLFSLEFAISEPKLNEMSPTFTNTMKMHLQQLRTSRRK
ncbi:Kinase, NEK [Giardia lamblia P15]|uniref:non-specific serine/threonine protein kinase n=1 Tax=Giardia intestinalis (strain P15) TaxID=658858 RepID=E1F6H3_GIAIA|nr:Kinase, NEK [Giardia lamblia P15]